MLSTVGVGGIISNIDINTTEKVEVVLLNASKLIYAIKR